MSFTIYKNGRLVKVGRTAYFKSLNEDCLPDDNDDDVSLILGVSVLVTLNLDLSTNFGYLY